MNPSHERAVAELIRSEHPEPDISASSEVAPVIKEYERGATTMLNAYLSGTTDRSISALEERLACARPAAAAARHAVLGRRHLDREGEGSRDQAASRPGRRAAWSAPRRSGGCSASPT